MTQKTIEVRQMLDDDQRKLIKELLFVKSHRSEMVKHKHKDPQGGLNGHLPPTPTPLGQPTEKYELALK